MNLDFNSQKLRDLLDQASALVSDLYAKLPEKKITSDPDPAEVRSLFDKPMPVLETDPQTFLRETFPLIINNSTWNISPRFNAYVTSAGSHVGIIAELLSAAMNLNNAKWHIAPAAAEIELVVMKWLCEFIGYTNGRGGILVNGGSEANLVGLRLARDANSPLFKNKGGYGEKPLVAYASNDGHSCLEKSMEMLGLGRENLVKIPLTNQFGLDTGLLEARIQKDLSGGYRPFCVVATAGTANTGAVDDLNAIADICAKYGLWFHVDGAYGAPAGSIQEKQYLFNGMNRADSIALDPHKWLQVPISAGCILVKSYDALRGSFSVLPDYLKAQTDSTERWDWLEYMFHLTRNFSALKVWMQFQVYGSTKLRAVVADHIAMAERFCTLVERSDDFELLAPAPLSIVCFRYKPEQASADDVDLDEINKQIIMEVEKCGRYFITSTKIKERFALRVIYVNHRTSIADVDGLFYYLREVGAGLRRKSS